MTKIEKERLTHFQKLSWRLPHRNLTMRDFQYQWFTFIKKQSKNYKKESSIDKKVKNIFMLMELLVERNAIKANDVEIAKKLECTTRTLKRYFEEISRLYSHIVKIKKGKNNVYELVSVSYVFQKIISSTDNLTWLIELVDKWDSSILGELHDKVSSDEKDVFFYKNSPFEELESQKQKDIFSNLKKAIMHKQYVNIEYVYDEERTHQKAIPLKLIFMEQNWYVAIVDQKIEVRFLRIFFIQTIKVLSNDSYATALPQKQLEAYNTFLKTFQNPMSRYDKPKEVATLQASPKVAKYFQAHMKRHFNSETFIKKNIDGSVVFSVEYTQSMEILPFVKKWLPDIRILSPKSLEEKLRSDLMAYLK